MIQVSNTSNLLVKTVYRCYFLKTSVITYPCLCMFQIAELDFLVKFTIFFVYLSFGNFDNV